MLGRLSDTSSQNVSALMVSGATGPTPTNCKSPKNCGAAAHTQ
jgi:hypothetical protein